MGKPFEIVYSPANWNAPAGGVAVAWSVPYGGLNVQSPENLISPSQTPSMDNILLRNSELRSRPSFNSTYLPSPDGTPILGCGSFLSKTSVWHTFSFTTRGLYQLQAAAQATIAAGGNPWSRVGGPALSGNYVRWRVFQNILYYTDGGTHLSAWDGAALVPISDAAYLGVGVAGLPPATTTLIGSLYIGELDNHLMMAYTTETPFTAGLQGVPSTFPQRVRWSNSGFNPVDAFGVFGANLGTAGATFDPTVFVNAGQVDFLDVPDQITGLLFLGRTGYIFRQNGITEVSATGSGAAPFDFNHLWASEQGIGSIYTTTLAQYGDNGIFVAADNVYQISSSALQPIGGGARDAIMADIAQTFQSPTAAIAPGFNLGYTYLVYMLFIALPSGDTRVYVYSFEDNNWSRWTIPGAIVGVPNKCWIGDSPITITSQASLGSSTGGFRGSGGSGGGAGKGGGGSNNGQGEGGGRKE